MSKEDVEKAIEEVMEVADEQCFAMDGTEAEVRAFHIGIIAACKRRIADAGSQFEASGVADEEESD
jgi:hypothetical protein